MGKKEKRHKQKKHPSEKIRRYLRQHQDVTLDVLRNNPDLGAQAFQRVLDLRAAGKQGPERDTYEYPVLATYGYGGRGPLQSTLPKPVPFQIRQFANYPPARRAINALTNPILDLPFTVTVRRPLGGHAHDEQPEPTPEQHERIVAFTEMLLRPNNEHDGRQFLEMLLEDLLSLGAGPFEVEDNRSDARPLFLWPVDAQSVRINCNWQPGKDTYRYSQGRGFLFGSVGTTDEIKLEESQLCYPMLNPRTSSPFGYGYLEVAFDTINAFVGAFTYAERRASNNTPNFGIFLGENVTINQTRLFQHYWENEIEGYGKVPILGGGRSPQVFSMTGTGEDALFLKWQEWLVRIIAMAFGVSPMRLSLERDVNRSTADQGASDDWATIAPVANTIRAAYTHWLLWKRLGWDDLEFQWQIRTADELKQAEIIALQWNADNLTVDEARKIYERPALADGLGDMTKTPYQAAVKAAALPVPAAQTSQGTQPIITPFADQEDEELSPEQRAFVRELMREKRQKRHGIGLAAVAG